MRIAAALFGLMLPSVAVQASAAPAVRDAPVYAAVEANRSGLLDLLRDLVNIDSGTGDVRGAAQVDAILSPRLRALGADVRSVPAESRGLGNNLIATLTGTGRSRILLIAHIDTVFAVGTAKARPFHIDGQRAYGPGVSDEKGGVVTAVTALKLLHDLGFRNYAQMTLLLETSEERGSPGTRKLIEELVSQNDVELNMEPGDAPDALTVWRKGSATYHIVVHGRAAHAGVAPQDGRNAAVELLHQLRAVDAMPHSGPGLTANLTVLRAGERNNVIPDLAEGQVNVRVRTTEQFDQILAQLRRNAQSTVIPDTRVEVITDPAFPPLPENAGTRALAKRALAIYAQIGRTLTEAGNGGASESALAAAAGVPALDGLGPVGGGFHSDQEWLDLTTVTPRLYLLTKLLMDLGPNPPARALP